MIADRPLNLQAIALEETETKIRQTVKYEYFSRTQKSNIDSKIKKIIAEGLKEIKIPELREAALRSLWRFYNAQYTELQRSFGRQLPIMNALFLLLGKKVNGDEFKPSETQRQEARYFLTENGFDEARTMGVPLQMYSQEYINKHVNPALERLAEQEAKDPDDISGRNSLRNRAEMEVRYNSNQSSISDLKSRGVRLVIASVHADCSVRCRGWQGRVYSLDGTRGVTDDGRSYVPLEEATDVFYTTNAGKTYKNGLLGFNCRHYLVEYKSGYYFPKPNPIVEEREYRITEEQRQLERQVRKWRIRAVENKGQDDKAYKKARKKAIEWNKTYIKFSQDNHRAYYPSRVKII